MVCARGVGISITTIRDGASWHPSAHSIRVSRREIFGDAHHTHQFHAILAGKRQGKESASRWDRDRVLLPVLLQRALVTACKEEKMNKVVIVLLLTAALVSVGEFSRCACW